MSTTFSATRPSRHEELRRLRRFDPARLIDLFRQAVGPYDIERLRAGITYDAMIEAILEYESRPGKP